MVYPGDIVIVPKAGIVYVLGDVARPGGYTMSNNDSQMTVLEALATAGDTNKTAIISKVKLVRTTTSGITEIPISLGAMRKGKQPDIAMQSNDVLYVPSSYMKNLALNASPDNSLINGGGHLYAPVTDKSNKTDTASEVWLSEGAGVGEDPTNSFVPSP